MTKFKLSLSANPPTPSHPPPEISESELYLIRRLRDAPKRYNYRYEDSAQAALLEGLFLALAGNSREYLKYFFPNGPPPKGAKPGAWNLSDAQGAVEGAEYSAAARGKPCGHIFKNGEATYRCKTCSLDDTCVLCSKCFESSDHSAHQVYVSISPGNTGCCDCGDPEAWRYPVKCAIHTLIGGTDTMDMDNATELPEGLQRSIRSTIARAIDYLCDVISCAPEQLRRPKSEEEIRKDEEMSRLTSKYYEVAETDSDNHEYCLVLWNDEKHTINEVEEQVARACKMPKAFGKQRAQETDSIGRSLVTWSDDIKQLLRISKIIEQIKITVTIRSARDTFREQMCATIIEWLQDIAGCTVSDNTVVLRNTICEELLGVWRIGSKAWNTEIGKDGIDDHSLDEGVERFGRRMVLPLEIVTEAPETDNMDVDEDGETADAEPQAEDEQEEGENEEEDMDVDYQSAPRRQILLTIDQAPLANFEPVPHAGPVQRSSAADHLPPVPPTPGSNHQRSLGPPPPGHWTERPAALSTRYPLPPYENLRQRVRLDWLILFDLRLWKTARINLRDLYIGTVVAIPEFKRILGLRFSGLYTMLSQLYLIADREPDHSIINLSLQILTTPSITAEVVKRGNFLTSLLAIFYTFLTTRQVGYPMDVNPNATLAFDAGSLANRRMHHFFQDVRYLLSSAYVQERIRMEERYILQFLDLVKLHQGICPNLRAVGDHVEFEAEAWISASLITREINKMSRHFSESFRGKNIDKFSLYRAISTAAKYTIINSMGWERHRFSMAEIKYEAEFSHVSGFEFDVNTTNQPRQYEVVKFAVDSQYISFHHALHYTLSWLIEAAKDKPLPEVRRCLMFDWEAIRDFAGAASERREYEDLALAMFDYPLRVCAWLSQMKTNLWVRNGFGLRHQMQTYKSVSQRDLTHNRDIFLLQTALVMTNPSRMLVSMIERFNLCNWMQGQYKPPEGYEDIQILDVAEDFLHLLIAILSDRLCLMPLSVVPDVALQQLRREIIHILCFKPVTFSELQSRLPERLLDHERFQDVLTEMTNYKPPDGLSDSGTFELKERYQYEVDPYILQFTKNQREETEQNYKVRMAKRTGQPETEIVFEPKVLEIPGGVFKEISAFTKSPIFAQVIYYSLSYALHYKHYTPMIQDTRVETYLQICLHLCLLAVLEDSAPGNTMGEDSFVLHALHKRARVFDHQSISLPDDGHRTIAGILYCLGQDEKFKTQWPRVKLILRRMRQKRPQDFDGAAAWAHDLGQKMELDSSDTKEQEAERKKRLARERQAKIMAQFQQQQKSFLTGAGVEGFDDMSGSEDAEDWEEVEHTWKFPTETCILCQEETNDTQLYGSFAMIAESNILRQTSLRDSDYAYEVIESPRDLDRQFERARPFGVASRNTDTIKKLTSDATEVTVKRQILGKGFPPGCVRRGPVATGCGHITHFSCFERYYENSKRRPSSHIARVHPERFEMKEFTCPLCKALGNTFLPIVWRVQEEKLEGVIHSEKKLVDWLATTVGPQISKLHKTVDPSVSHDKSTLHGTQKTLVDYGVKAMTAPIATRLKQLWEKTLDRDFPPRTHPGVFPNEGGNRSHTSSNPSIVDELHRVYKRIPDTLRANQIPSVACSDSGVALQENSGDLTHCDTLMRLLGFSISSVEIAQRGVGSEPGNTLLDKISTQTVSHLKILAETICSYITVGALQGKEKSITINQFRDIQERQLKKLFVGHPQISTLKPKYQQARQPKPLFSEDLFVFLAECSLCLVPSLKLEFHEVMQLCYLAEIVKATIALIHDTNKDALHKAVVEECLELGYSEQQTVQFQRFAEVLEHYCSNEGDIQPIIPSRAEVYRAMVDRYATAFLRKCVILVHVRYGVNFHHTGYEDMERSELFRLSKALSVPTVDDLISICLNPGNDGQLIRSMISGWCRDREASNEKISLSHPCIFELVGLPLHFDTLVEEAMKRRCLNTGKDLTEPAVCLFCGEIFCSQALCCSKDNKGGCNQHTTACGQGVGIFINIRKCHVLFLHAEKGTWAAAPYLDKHGETDSGLRRNRQLFLNQRRYDALLRNVWLQHQIPTTISRKLEADINTGGWDTL